MVLFVLSRLNGLIRVGIVGYLYTLSAFRDLVVGGLRGSFLFRRLAMRGGDMSMIGWCRGMDLGVWVCGVVVGGTLLRYPLSS